MEHLRKILTDWQTLVALAIGVGGPLAGFWQQLIAVDPSKWTWQGLAAAAGLAGVLLLFILYRARSQPPSELVQPDALRLDPKTLGQLVGRGNDLERLLKTTARTLVFMVSESGCGKSVLMRVGVAENPVFKERFLPIYIDMAALDWEEMPLRELREGFMRAIGSGDPAYGALDARSTPQKYATVFAEYHKRTLRRPLLLLDQIDDFQAAPEHRRSFLPDETRVWRTA